MGYKEILHKITARYKKNKLYSYLLKSTGNTLSGKKWIFILGCYNSGTTLLDSVLAQHPSISGLPDEGVMLTDQLVRPEDFSWNRMWHKCEDKMLDSMSNEKMDPIIIKNHWSHFYENNEYLLEKSIANVLRIPFFQTNFEPVYFIHIVRNGYAVAEGIRRKARVLQRNPVYREGDIYPIHDCAGQWVRSLEVVEESKSTLKNFMEVSYETFTNDPLTVVNQITNFLDIKEYEKDFFDKSFSIHEKDSTIKNMNASSFDKLSPKEIEIINEVAGDYLQKYGYDLL